MPRSGSFVYPFHVGHSNSPSARAGAGSSVTSLMIPPYPGSNAQARDRVQALQAYYQQQPSNSPAMLTPIISGTRRSSDQSVGSIRASGCLNRSIRWFLHFLQILQAETFKKRIILYQVNSTLGKEITFLHYHPTRLTEIQARVHFSRLPMVWIPPSDPAASSKDTDLRGVHRIDSWFCSLSFWVKQTTTIRK